MLPERGSPQCGAKNASVGLCVMPCDVILNWSRLTRMFAMAVSLNETAAFGYPRERVFNGERRPPELNKSSRNSFRQKRCYWSQGTPTMFARIGIIGH
jgi:hypothetical protein